MQLNNQIKKKSIALIAFLSLFLGSCKKELKAQSASATEVNNTTLVNYQLVWSDEFSGTTVDTSNWNFETGAGGWGNNEKEFYQASNAKVLNGALRITAKKPTVKFPYYTSSRMTTKGKREFQYGKMEARIKLPVAQGLWPAFWMLGANIDAVNWPA